jgi:hypothetical protein
MLAKEEGMDLPAPLLVVVLILFSILTGVSVFHHGLIGIFTEAFRNTATMQVFFDLFIALFLVMVWMWHDAKSSDRLFWPWAVLTLAIGSFGPLLYLLFGKRR